MFYLIYYLSMNILTTWINPLDESITNFFKNFLGSESFVEWMTIFSCFFVFFFVIALMFILKKENRWVGLLMLITLVFTFLLNDLVLKNIFTRTRPFIDLGLSTSPGFSIDGYSFPSGHSALVSAGSFSFFFYYLIINKRKNKTFLYYSILFFIIAFLVILSRIALLHHYFTDCLAGLIEGVLTSLIVTSIYKLINSHFYKKKKSTEEKTNI